MINNIKYYFIFLLIISFSCNKIQDHKTGDPSLLLIPQNGAKFKYGDSILITVSDLKLYNLDSIQVIIDSGFVLKANQIPTNFIWNPKSNILGNHLIKIIAYKYGVIKDIEIRQVTVLSNIIPLSYSYKIINTFLHDTSSFTEGLVFYNDFMYEGIGLYGKSGIQKINFQTGVVVDKVNLPQQDFGEGITIMQDTIYQLTWKSKLLYTYNLNFKLLNSFPYPMEGWGLTNNGKQLIASNGTSTIYFLNKNTLKMERRIEVYNQNKPIEKLNELEYIDGFIFSNIWKSDTIIKIDPETGRVLACLNLKEISALNTKTYQENVLNGIAYDKNNNDLFITGKKWSKLYQIKVK